MSDIKKASYFARIHIFTLSSGNSGNVLQCVQVLPSPYMICFIAALNKADCTYECVCWGEKGLCKPLYMHKPFVSSTNWTAVVSKSPTNTYTPTDVATQTFFHRNIHIGLDSSFAEVFPIFLCFSIFRVLFCIFR